AAAFRPRKASQIDRYPSSGVRGRTPGNRETDRCRRRKRHAGQPPAFGATVTDEGRGEMDTPRWTQRRATPAPFGVRELSGELEVMRNRHYLAWRTSSFAARRDDSHPRAHRMSIAACHKTAASLDAQEKSGSLY